MSEQFMRFPNGLKKALTLSYDDCVEEDIQLIELLNKNNIKATFNISSGTLPEDEIVFEKGAFYRPNCKKKLKEIYDGCHEVAIHGYNHPFYTNIPQDMVAYEVIEDRKYLENKFGRIIRGSAYPYGVYNDEIIEVLKRCGIVYARTVQSTHSFDVPNNWLTLNPTCHHDDEMLFELEDKFINETPGRYPWLFYLWGHTFEFEKNDNWDRIEKFVEKIANKDDIWYATNIEIYEYVEAYNKVLFSVEGKYARNDSNIDVWRCINGNTIKIPAGQTISL